MTRRLVAVWGDTSQNSSASRPVRDDDQIPEQGSFTLTDLGVPVSVLRSYPNEVYVSLTKEEIRQLIDHHEWRDDYKFQREEAQAA